ncbi:hypothetical protein ANANG_G00309960 [Anguilla anguilla]|uniref:Podocalyxin n=1 Tax=Anguilla anguilla TaxID=7936 RepID=A0A9D3LJ84_ANGAN|nr:hypothetical protein ANANG_G00309960 [Anguilla anguilla]
MRTRHVQATASEQPQQALPTVTSASSVSAPRQPPVNSLSRKRPRDALPTDAPASTAHTSHNPAGMPPTPQTQSPSSAATTVTVSQDAPGPGGAVTTGNGTGILPKTTDATTKGGDREETVVYVKGQMDEKGKRELLGGVCGELMEAMQVDKCTLTTNPDGTIKSAYLQVDSTVLKELQEKHKQKEKEEPPKNTTLIAILCSCAALLAMTAAFIAYTTCHRRSYRKNQQHLTEELQTVENGYHDNPTLEVMEVQPEMQEKKAAPNGEFNDSWIVPFDALAKEDMPDEEGVTPSPAPPRPPRPPPRPCGCRGNPTPPHDDCHRNDWALICRGEKQVCSLCEFRGNSATYGKKNHRRLTPLVLKTPITV